MAASVTLVAERDKVLILMERRATRCQGSRGSESCFWLGVHCLRRLLTSWLTEKQRKSVGLDCVTSRPIPLQLGPTSPRLTTPPTVSQLDPKCCSM